MGAIELVDDAQVQGELFTREQQNPKLMQCLDSINAKFGSQTVGIAAKNRHQPWRMKRAYLSPQYTTNWRHLPKINCDLPALHGKVQSPKSRG